MSLAFREIPLDFEGRDASRAGRGDGLAPNLVLDIACSEDPGDRSPSRPRLGPNVPLGVDLQLPRQEFRVGAVADGVEEAAGGYVFLCPCLVSQHSDTSHAPSVAQDLQGFSIPMDGDLGILEDSILHGPGSSEFAFPDEKVNHRAEP